MLHWSNIYSLHVSGPVFSKSHPSKRINLTANVLFPLAKMTGMVWLLTSFILSWEMSYLDSTPDVFCQFLKECHLYSKL